MHTLRVNQPLFSCLRTEGSLARIYRSLQMFCFVSLSALDRVNTDLLMKYVVVGNGSDSERSVIKPQVANILTKSIE